MQFTDQQEAHSLLTHADFLSAQRAEGGSVLEESWRKEQCHPHGDTASSQQQKGEVDKEEEGKTAINKALILEKLPIIKPQSKHKLGS